MLNFIRWQGLAAFAVIVALLLSISLMFMDSWIKSATINSLQKLNGAEVNISEVEHSFSPFTISFINLQLTDKSSPDKNQLQAEKIDVAVHVMPLLSNKLIIEKLNVSGLKFAQDRQQAGTVFDDQELEIDKAKAEETALAQGQELPSVDTILANSPLKITQALQAAQQAFDKNSQLIEQQYSSLPDSNKLQEYKRRLQALADIDYKDPVKLAAAKEEFDKVIRILQLEKKKLTVFNNTVQTAQEELKQHSKNIKQASADDFELLKGAVQGEAQVFSEITEALFGAKAKYWSDYLLVAYNKVAPMLTEERQQQQQTSRENGQWIEFGTANKTPSFLIKNAAVSVHIQQQRIESHWSDITTEHDTLGRPTTFSVTAGESPLWQLFELSGDLWLRDKGINAQQQWQIKAMPLHNMALTTLPQLSTELAEGELDSIGSLKISEQIINGTSSININQLSLNASGQSSTTSFIANSLNQLNALSMKVELSGQATAPAINVSSNLDKQLKDAVFANFGQENQQSLNELKQKLNAKTQGQLTTNSQSLAQWSQWQDVVTGDLTDVESMISSQFDSLLDKQKDKLLDKLKSKLFG